MVPGELRGPVETDFGIHILRLDKVLTTELPSFDELAFSLRERLRTEAAEDAFSEAKAKLEVLAYEALTSPSPQTRWG